MTHLSTPSRLAALAALLLHGAIFGFFYAWVCSTMWGLDALDPRIGLPAMQAMNASVRNPVFFVIFFLPPVASGVAALLVHRDGRRRPALLLAAAGALYLVGGIVLTTTVNVPMNEALAAVAVPIDRAEAAAIWAGYSPTWQAFNLLRTVVSGIALALVGAALLGEVPSTTRSVPLGEEPVQVGTGRHAQGRVGDLGQLVDLPVEPQIGVGAER